MRNKYLEILSLQPGASRQDIKKAYRKLSKIYHPDVNPAPGAKEKFMAIHEAYKFLTIAGPNPHASDAPKAYDYDAHKEAYEIWRKKAREFARKRATDAAIQRMLLIEKLLGYFRWFVIVIGIFNILMVSDYFLPPVDFDEEISTITIDYDNLRVGENNQIDLLETPKHITFKGFEMFITGDLNPAIEHYDQVVVYASRFFKKPEYMVITIDGESHKYQEQYKFYHIFGFLIIVSLGCLLFYTFITHNPESRLSLAVLLFVLSIIQFSLIIAV